MRTALKHVPDDLVAVEAKNIEHLVRIQEDVVGRAKELALPIHGLDKFLAYLDASGTDVLDIGCGIGRVAPYLEARGKRYTGVDFSERFLQEARIIAPRGHFVCASITALPFSPASFDGVFACCSLQYTPKEYMLPTIQQIHQILRRNGVLVVMLPHCGASYEEGVSFEDGSTMHHSWWDIHEFSGTLVAAGFMVHDAYWIHDHGTSYFVARRVM